MGPLLISRISADALSYFVTTSSKEGDGTALLGQPGLLEKDSVGASRTESVNNGFARIFSDPALNCKLLDLFLNGCFGLGCTRF